MKPSSTLLISPPLRPSPFFFSFTIECISWHWVSRSDIEKKKPKKKKITRSLGIGGPNTPGRCQKLTFTYLDEKNAQHTVKNVPVFVPVFLYAVTMLIFQIKRIISSKKRLNFFFLLKMPKIWVSRMTVNGEKKGDGLISLQYFGLFEHLICSLTQDLERLLTVCWFSETILIPKNFLRFNTDRLPLLGGGVGASGLEGEERWRGTGGGIPIKRPVIKFQNNGVKEL